MKLYSFIFLILAFNITYAQRTDEQRKQALSELLEAEKTKSAQRKSRIEKYTKEKGVEIWQNKSEGKPRLLYDVNEKGIPVFYETHSSGAAITTGAARLNDENQFGLRGRGMKIGVWDAGRAGNFHIELAGKVFSGDNAPLDLHAERVTGVILARGINPLAMGMAPDATAINYDFNNDIIEMISTASNDATSLLLSNHSYGPVAGWTRGEWLGDPDISDQEDWLYGFYEEDAKSWDELTYNAPYYLPVVSAGNERGVTGEGPYPPNGPYDILVGHGVAKNNITVGGIHKITSSLASPSNINMYELSSWGPTDDGRIKPDLVGAGVNILTVDSFFANDDYRSLSGTSYAAPNVTGTLALLQEFNQRLNGEYLKSATLKGLAIHTTHEAGIADGPDYSYGWGVLNAVEAADVILQENGKNNVVEEVILKNGEVYSLDINPKEGTEVKVTICWTDLPGTPVEPQLDPEDLMLVNDLDMRVTNTSEQHLPWILDPSRPNISATKGDNFRDNVEKIEFVSGNSDEYTITVGHKGELVTGAQEFSIIVSYESDEVSTYYRIGDNSEWNNPNNWSATSGGSPLGRVPRPENTVILDDNTFSQLVKENAPNEKVLFSLDADIEMERLIVFSEQEAEIQLNGHNIITNRGLMLSTDKVQFKGTGSIILKDQKDQKHYSIFGVGDNYSEANIIIDFEHGSTATLIENLNINSLTIEKGELAIKDSEATIGSFHAKEEGKVTIKNSKISIYEQFEIIDPSLIELQDVEFIFKPESIATLSLANIEGEQQKSDNNITVTVESGHLITETDVYLSELILESGTTLTISDGKTVSLIDGISVRGNADFPVSINSTGTATLDMDSRNLICLEFVNINGVNTEGEAIFNAGPNSTITNATGWQNKLCEDVLFADFINSTVCVESSEKFESSSNGKIEKYRWFIDDVLTSEKASPTIQFPEIKPYDVRLEIENLDGATDRITKSIMVVENNVPANEILLINGELVSAKPSNTYKWFRDNIILEDETGRTIAHRGIAGTYFVVTENDMCNRKSADFILGITATDDEALRSEYTIFPNPASNLLNVTVQSGFNGAVKIALIETSGRVVYQKSMKKSGLLLEEEINTSELTNGLYVVIISQGENRESKLIAIRK